MLVFPTPRMPHPFLSSLAICVHSPLEPALHSFLAALLSQSASHWPDSLEVGLQAPGKGGGCPGWGEGCGLRGRVHEVTCVCGLPLLQALDCTPSPPSPQSPRSRPIPGGMPLTPLPPPMVQGYPAHKRHCPGWGSLGTQGFWVPAGLGRHMGEPWALSWSSTLPRLGGSRLVQRLRRVLSPMADHTQPCLGQVGVTSPSGASRIL